MISWNRPAASRQRPPVFRFSIVNQQSELAILHSLISSLMRLRKNVSFFSSAFLARAASASFFWWKGKVPTGLFELSKTTQTALRRTSLAVRVRLVVFLGAAGFLAAFFLAGFFLPPSSSSPSSA